jgi:serine/threonine protein kinase
VTDFGTSKIIDLNKPKGIELTNNIGTPVFMAPELMADEGKSSSTAAAPLDVYSFGITMYTIFAQKHPYKEPAYAELSFWTLRTKIVSGIRPTVEGALASAPYAAIDLMKRCWDSDPNARPASFRDICEVLLVCIGQEGKGGDDGKTENISWVQAQILKPVDADANENTLNPMFRKSSINSGASNDVALACTDEADVEREAEATI